MYTPTKQRLKSIGLTAASIAIVLVTQFILYLIVFHPYLIGWGTTPEENKMSMSGDRFAESISCTRSIDIGKPAATVWEYCAALGADRNGFYSYDFLERLYGCEFATNPCTDKKELKVGQRISLDSSAGGDDGFEILEVEQGRSMVLAGWGAFLVMENSDGTSKLCVRTHEKVSASPLDWLFGKVFDAAHYVMERRMMLGIKDLAESNGDYTHWKDIIWLLSIFLSGIGGLVLIGTMKGWPRLWLPFVFFTAWQIVFLVLDPLPSFGIILIVFLGSLFYAKSKCHKS